jgi:hypothetical protein
LHGESNEICINTFKYELVIIATVEEEHCELFWAFTYPPGK